jgi:hypothetical protein
VTPSPWRESVKTDGERRNQQMKRSQLVKLILVLGGCLIVLIMWRLNDRPSADCKATIEFLDKASVIIATYKGDNLDRRLAELRLEYETHLARLPSEVRSAAITAFVGARELQRLRDELQVTGVSDENWKQRWEEAEKELYLARSMVQVKCAEVGPFR